MTFGVVASNQGISKMFGRCHLILKTCNDSQIYMFIISEAHLKKQPFLIGFFGLVFGLLLKQIKKKKEKSEGP